MRYFFLTEFVSHEVPLHLVELSITLVDVGARAERVLERSGLDQQAFSSIDHAQASDADRRNAATDLLNNDGSLESLHTQIDALHKRLTTLSREQAKTADC